MTKALGGASMSTIISGIYAIVNTLNGKRYVGSAVNIYKRRDRHFSDLGRGQHHSQYLQRAYDKYGGDQFTFHVIEQCDKSLLIEREQYYIDTLRPEYNVAPKAGTSLGVKQTKEMIERKSKRMIGHIVPQEVREKISAALKGRKLSYVRTPETRAKLSKANTGKTHSQKTRELMSLAKKGTKRSQEAIEKFKKSYKGRTNVPPHTPEARAKISTALRAYWAKVKQDKEQ
jgi:group I intron endonuclease